MPKKICLVKAMVFLIVMYGFENWTVKKAECRRTDAFELWCWRRLLRVSWTPLFIQSPGIKGWRQGVWHDRAEGNFLRSGIS